MRLSAIIFDFDGLILDTETPILTSWQEAFRERGVELSVDVWQQALGTHGVVDFLAHLETLTNQEIDREAVESEVRARNRERCRAERVRPGIEDRLTEAREAGLSLAVASSSSREWVEGWLDHHHLRERFDTVCTRDDVDRVKPAPDLLLLAANRMNVRADECLVLEDSPNGLRAAHAAQMRCVVIPNSVTRPLAFPGADLLIESAERSLVEIAEILDLTWAADLDTPRFGAVRNSPG
jgi:HAD superfamily hydrolase (TIGR01509 family)